jgi:hypothetical protein
MWEQCKNSGFPTAMWSLIGVLRVCESMYICSLSFCSFYKTWMLRHSYKHTHFNAQSKELERLCERFGSGIHSDSDTSTCRKHRTSKIESFSPYYWILLFISLCHTHAIFLHLSVSLLFVIHLLIDLQAPSVSTLASAADVLCLRVRESVSIYQRLNAQVES